MISVIIPVYNVEKYLRRCVDSLLRQTYQHIEIILVDDGSQDGSSALCDALAQEDSRIRVIHQKNQGASLARRNGISAAQGDYLAFVDSDDYVEPQYLQAMSDAILATGAEIAACQYIQHNENEEVTVNPVKAVSSLSQAELFSRFFKYEFWGFGGGLYPRKSFDNLYFPEYTIHEDHVVKLQMFSHCKSLAMVDAPLYHYLMHEGSLSHQAITKRAFDEFHNQLWAYNYCAEHLPQYSKHSEALVTETCLKLLSKLRNTENAKEYSEIRSTMQHFLRSHFLSALSNKQLYWKYKVLVLQCICPF